MPGPGAVLEGLLADPAHQEDVVVHAQGHEEDEAEERNGGVGPRETEDVVEHDGGDAHRGAVGQHHRGDQQDRRQHRAQQQHQDHQDDREDHRDDGDEVALGGGVGVQRRGGHAADQGAAVDLLQLLAEVHHDVFGLVGVCRVVQRGVDQHLAVPDRRGGGGRRSAGRARAAGTIGTLPSASR